MELPLGCTPQGNIELMPKKDILKLKSAPRLEQVGDNRPMQMEHRNHRVDDELILPHRANRADGIFGNDRIVKYVTGLILPTIRLEERPMASECRSTSAVYGRPHRPAPLRPFQETLCPALIATTQSASNDF